MAAYRNAMAAHRNAMAAYRYATATHRKSTPWVEIIVRVTCRQTKGATEAIGRDLGIVKLPVIPTVLSSDKAAATAELRGSTGFGGGLLGSRLHAQALLI